MTVTDRSRRKFLKASGVATLALVAGCISDDDDSDENGDDNGDTENGDTENGDDEYDFDGWFDNTANYEGVEDHTGEDEVTVMNGTGPQGFLFDPPAIVVDQGTTVVWEWTGDGGSHDVVAEDGSFDSDGLVAEEGYEFEHTFEEEGEFRYVCTAHEANGQKGVVVVE